MSHLRSRPTLNAVLLFAAIFVLRATVGSVGDAISFLYVIPVVMVAVAGGARASLLAGGPSPDLAPDPGVTAPRAVSFPKRPRGWRRAGLAADASVRGAR